MAERVPIDFEDEFELEDDYDCKTNELFRQFGFGKTTVADTAVELVMSPANIDISFYYELLRTGERRNEHRRIQIWGCIGDAALVLFDCLILNRTPHLYQQEGRELNEKRIREMVRFLGRAPK